MSLMTSYLREQIRQAIRIFTCATIHETEQATTAIIRHIENARAIMPETYNGIALDDLARGESYHPGNDA